jgi:LacI family transcriptional regulator
MSVGIKDIARALGISTGTVDRALHAKPGVNPATRARVLSMARRQLRISVHLPREIALFWDSLRESIREAAAPFAPHLHVDFQTYPGLGNGDIPLFETAVRAGTNGLIVTPGNPAALKPYIDDAARKNIAVVCVVTDAPDSARLASVSAAPFTSGAVVGEFLSRCQPGGGTVAFFTGWLSTHEHAEKPGPVRRIVASRSDRRSA